jgi:hypothetical protein
MQPVRQIGDDGVQVVPVTVITRAFRARPSSVADIRAFVRQHLSHAPLADDDARLLVKRAADVLLEAAGTGGTIEVALRIFPDRAEVDVLHAHAGAATSGTGTVMVTASVDTGASLAPAPPPPRPRPAAGVSFPEWLADALRREGMTMEAAARRLKVSVKTVSRWVRGTTEPRLYDLARIREIFGELPFP